MALDNTTGVTIDETEEERRIRLARQHYVRKSETFDEENNFTPKSAPKPKQHNDQPSRGVLGMIRNFGDWLKNGSLKTEEVRLKKGPLSENEFDKLVQSYKKQSPINFLERASLGEGKPPYFDDSVDAKTNGRLLRDSLGSNEQFFAYQVARGNLSPDQAKSMLKFKNENLSQESEKTSKASQQNELNSGPKQAPDVQSEPASKISQIKRDENTLPESEKPSDARALSGIETQEKIQFKSRNKTIKSEDKIDFSSKKPDHLKGMTQNPLNGIYADARAKSVMNKKRGTPRNIGKYKP